MELLVTPDSVSRCLSKNVFVMAMVLVSEVSKTRLKSPSHEITLGFRMSGRILSAVATSAVVALIVSVVVVVIVVGRGNDDGAGINESVTGETSGETALAATPESKIVNS